MEFRLPEFEGPLDLLLMLIQQREVDVDALSLLSITEQYLSAVAELPLNMEDAAHFIDVASILIEMKAKYLNKGVVDFEHNDDADPVQQLVLRLREYRRFKQISAVLERRAGTLDAHFFREPEDRIEPDEMESLRLDSSLLIEAFRRVMQNLQRFDDERQTYFERIRRDRYTVSDRIRSIRRIVRLRAAFQFSELFDDETTRSELVVTFLALLELLKSGEINVVQTEAFGDILIRQGGTRERGDASHES